jgi:hypothetical protein
MITADNLSRGWAWHGGANQVGIRSPSLNATICRQMNAEFEIKIRLESRQNIGACVVNAFF